MNEQQPKTSTTVDEPISHCIAGFIGSCIALLIMLGLEEEDHVELSLCLTLAIIG